MSCAKCNEINYFVLSVKLREELCLPQTPLNTLFSMKIVFFMFLRNVQTFLPMATYACYFLFNTFFS